MDRERLTRLLEEPGKVARGDLADLKALTEKYPWFSGAHLLHAVGEQAQGDVLANEALRTTAAHIPSRAVLFDLTDSTFAEAAADLAKAAPLAAAEPPPGPPPSNVPTSPEAKAPVIEEPPAPAIVRPMVPAPPPLEPSPAPAAGVSANELDRQIVEAALTSAYDLTWGTRLEERPPAPRVERSAPPVPVPEPPPEVPPPPAAVPHEAAPRITKTAKLKFTDWLELGDRPAVVARPPANETRENAPAAPPGPLPVVSTPAVDAKTLIDRFIEQETPPPVRKAEFYTPQQAAKKSLDDSAGLVSETLARIYEKQGNFQKAIEAYKKLALKYPEKSAYFAALSKELEGRSNT